MVSARSSALVVLSSLIASGCAPEVDDLGGGSVTVTFERPAEVGIEGSFTVDGLTADGLADRNTDALVDCGAVAGRGHGDEHPGWRLIACADAPPDVQVSAPCGEDVRGVEIDHHLGDSEFTTSRVTTSDGDLWTLDEREPLDPEDRRSTVEPLEATGSRSVVRHDAPAEGETTCGEPVADSTRRTVAWAFDAAPLLTERDQDPINARAAARCSAWLGRSTISRPCTG